MERATRTVELPISKGKAKLYGWITAEDAEHIEAATLEAVKTTTSGVPGVPGSTVAGTVDSRKAVQEHARRQIQAFVAEIGEGEAAAKGKEAVLAAALALPSDDYDFLLLEIAEIEAANKKKLPERTTAKPTSSAG